MQEIVTFLKSLLSRKLLLTVAGFIALHQGQIPARYQAIGQIVLAGLYFLANVLETKVTPRLPPQVDSDAVAAQAEALASATSTEPSLPDPPTTPPDGAPQ
jgi:hypothetical protein